MENENRGNMWNLNVCSKSMASQINLNETPVTSPREGQDDWLCRAAESNVSVCSECRTEVPARRGAAAQPTHPGWKCLRCRLNNIGKPSSEGGSRMASFDLNASPPPEDHDGEVVAMASRNDRGNEASTSFHPFPPSRGRVAQMSSRDPCPCGKLLLIPGLPSYLTGDALQVWELALRFCEVLGLGQTFSLQELVSELVSPWLDSSLDSHLGPSILAKINGSLLKLLVSELLSRLAAFACPYDDSRESKSRRGKMKDSDCLAVLKKTALDMLPVNGLTWHEIARRYTLALMSMEGNLEPTKIVFRCFHGDGGILCGALTGTTALEADAVILEDAMCVVFGSLQGKDEILSACERESDSTGGAQANEVRDDAIPEWAQVLEPVRTIQANVGARVRNCIYQALERNPPEWAKDMLEHSISKAVYKANNASETKRVIISILEDLRSLPCQNLQKKEAVNIKRLSDISNKQCRIVLRLALAADKDRVFCILTGKTFPSPNDNDDAGLLGYRAMVSRPLDFRTIDVRLAAGAYGGSHEAFIDDVREILRNTRNAHSDRSDLFGLAETLSRKFEELYEKEVLSLINKVAQPSNVNGSNYDAVKERDALIARLVKNPLPGAPWDKGICKVCSMDKDDDKVLSGDKCNFEYHRYCLHPPLLKTPKGDWYCPSCVAGQSAHQGDASGSVAATQCRKRRRIIHGGLTSNSSKNLAQLANLLESKECWDFTVEERMFLVKFLFEEALNSATIRDHMDKCAPQAIEFQHKLQSLASELKLLKFKEEMLFSSTHYPDQADTVSQTNTLKKGIRDLQDSIASLESELQKVSLRKDFLGCDSNGRVYWAFHSPGARPWIVASESLTSQEGPSEESGSDQWMSYESYDDIEKLIGWLSESNAREKELRNSILQLQSSKPRDGYPENRALISQGGPRGKNSSADFPTTKAMTVLEKRTGLCFQDGKMYRCECLELLLPSNYHCPCYHQSFPTSDQHSTGRCRALETANGQNQTTEQKQNKPKIAFGLLKNNLVNECSLRTLTGRATEEVLRFLKINLLDVDAALPEDAIRVSRSGQDRRLTWRLFLKSASSIYEMVQATIIVEDMIKSEYLHSDWWYWSSPSTAAKITTLSALALRFYALDSAISYEKAIEHPRNKQSIE